jgi:hypothetical protein
MTVALGDMDVIGNPPPKLWKALAVIAKELHPAFARETWIEHREKSKESCVLSSLAVRDFLLSLGFIDAQVRPVVTILLATRGKETVHSLGIGVPGHVVRVPDTKRDWNGHLVAMAAGFIIDTTLYPVRRPQWPDLAGMLAMPLGVDPCPSKYWGLTGIAAASVSRRDGVLFEIGYLDNPGNSRWATGGDNEEWRRAAAVAAMRRRFGSWSDAA